MTVASTLSKKQYDGTGVTTSFDFNFRADSTDSVIVVLTDSDGDDTVQQETTHYTITLNSDQATSPGGTIVMLTAPASDEKLTIYRDTDQTQETDLENQGAFYAQTIENMIDKATMIIQELQEQLNRATLVPVTADDAEEALTETIGDARYLKLSGGTMTGNVGLGTHVITSDNTIFGNTDLINQQGADARYLKYSGAASDVTMGDYEIYCNLDPTQDTALAHKRYVDYYTKVSEGHLSSSTNSIQLLASGVYQNVINVSHTIPSGVSSIDAFITINGFVFAPDAGAIRVYTKVIDSVGNTIISEFMTETHSSIQSVHINRSATFTITSSSAITYTVQMYCTNITPANITGYVFSPTIVIGHIHS